MATLSGVLRTYSSKWYPRTILRASKKNNFVPYEIVANNADEWYGVIWLNKATDATAGGSGITITSNSSTVAFTE